MACLRLSCLIAATYFAFSSIHLAFSIRFTSTTQGIPYQANAYFIYDLIEHHSKIYTFCYYPLTNIGFHLTFVNLSVMIFLNILTTDLNFLIFIIIYSILLFRFYPGELYSGRFVHFSVEWVPTFTLRHRGSAPLVELPPRRLVHPVFCSFDFMFFIAV